MCKNIVYRIAEQKRSYLYRLNSLANFDGHLATGVQSQGGSGINEYITEQLDPTLSWKDVEWLVKFSKLPVIVKGILTKEDATLAADYGVCGIWVSNHGARQVDSVPASVDQAHNLEILNSNLT